MANNINHQADYVNDLENKIIKLTEEKTQSERLQQLFQNSLVQLKKSRRDYLSLYDNVVSTNLELQKEIQQHKGTEKKLQYRIDLSHIISSISSIFINLPAKKIEDQLHATMNTIGNISEADYIAIYKYNDNTRILETSHSWQNTDNECGSQNTNEYVDLNLWKQNLNKGHHVFINQDKHDTQNNTENQILQTLQIHSMLITPVIYSGSLFGAFRLDTNQKERPWTPDIIALFKLVGEIFISAIKREQAENELEKYQHHLEEIVELRTDQIKSVIQHLEQEISKRDQAEVALEEKNKLLAEMNRDLKETQKRILKQDKMASLGQLAAGVAHEINNPAGFVSSNLSTLSRYVKKISAYLKDEKQMMDELIKRQDPALKKIIHAHLELKNKSKIDFIFSDVIDIVKDSVEGINRIDIITKNLKSFARSEEIEFKEQFSVNDEIEKAVTLTWNELKHKATIIKYLGELPLIKVLPNQLSQVFMNLLINATHAIEKFGEIKIKSWFEKKQIHITIIDNGKGIEEKNITRIFEPFFTTKSVDSGTGLGLSITYDIIKKHGGDIAVDSTPNQGTCFTIRLPVKEDDE